MSKFLRLAHDLINTRYITMINIYKGEYHIKIGKSVEQLKTERKDTSLLGRWASPDEIAWPILWMASSEASFITGTNLVVDGGLHIK